MMTWDGDRDGGTAHTLPHPTPGRSSRECSTRNVPGCPCWTSPAGWSHHHPGVTKPRNAGNSGAGEAEWEPGSPGSSPDLLVEIEQGGPVLLEALHEILREVPDLEVVPGKSRERLREDTAPLPGNVGTRKRDTATATPALPPPFGFQVEALVLVLHLSHRQARVEPVDLVRFHVFEAEAVALGQLDVRPDPAAQQDGADHLLPNGSGQGIVELWNCGIVESWNHGIVESRNGLGRKGA